MTVAVIEACRSPDRIKPDTEALVLSMVFQERAIDHAIYGNEGVWPDRLSKIDQETLRACLRNDNVRIVHLAMHGDDDGLVLSWTAEESIARRTPVDRLTPRAIASMTEWRGKMVVSGACASAALVPAWLEAGTTVVVAPEREIPWPRLGAFFGAFYSSLLSGESAQEALAGAKARFREFECYRAYASTAPANRSGTGRLA